MIIMTMIVQKNSIDLEKFYLEFGKNIEQFYQECFGDLTNREACLSLGYRVSGNSVTQATNIRKKKRIRASRFLLMCNNLEMDPNALISKYKPIVVQLRNPRDRRGCKLEEVEEKLRDNVYETICDSL